MMPRNLRRVGRGYAAYLDLAISQFIAIAVLAAVLAGCYASRRFMAITFPDSLAAADHVAIWLLAFAALWPFIHAIAWIWARRGERPWYPNLALCLVAANVLCGCILIYFAWRPLATALYKYPV